MMVSFKFLLVAIVSLHYVESKQLFDLKIIENPEGINITVANREGECVPNVRCIPKAEAGGFAVLYKDGDPCFTYDKQRLCLTSLAGVAVECNCANAACNCIGAGEIPKGFCHPTEICLTKEKLNNPLWDSYFNTGDPCILYGNERKCFVGSGSIVNCDCSNSECGCKDLLQCDNTKNKTYSPCDTSLYQSNHTMCTYKTTGSACGDKICRLGLTSNEKQILVDAHNKVRSRVANGNEPGQPKAANMNKVEWDEEIAVVAQRFADQCVTGHDKVRSTASFSYVGQNGYGGGSPAPLPTEYNVTDAVEQWFSEVKDFSSSNIDPYVFTPEPVTGHYTQVVWAETKKIGCGISQFLEGTSYRTVIVCNYGPGGNMQGTAMYKVGEPGSQCPGATENGLCL